MGLSVRGEWGDGREGDGQDAAAIETATNGYTMQEDPPWMSRERHSAAKICFESRGRGERYCCFMGGDTLLRKKGTLKRPGNCSASYVWRQIVDRAKTGRTEGIVSEPTWYFPPTHTHTAGFKVTDNIRKVNISCRPPMKTKEEETAFFFFQSWFFYFPLTHTAKIKVTDNTGKVNIARHPPMKADKEEAGNSIDKSDGD